MAYSGAADDRTHPDQGGSVCPSRPVRRSGPARISINPAPTVAVSGWPDPDLAYIDVFPNGTAKIIAKGKLLTYTVEVLPK